MSMILLPALLLLAYLLLASGKLMWSKAALLSLLLLSLSAWWLVDRLSGNGIDAATLYHLQAGMRGAGVGDFAGDLLRFAGLALLSLLPLALVPLLRGRLGGVHRRHPPAAVTAGFVAAFALALVSSPLYSDARRLHRQLQPVDTSGIAAEYRIPSGPLARPRNIVWIYAESVERTYLDQDTFPGLMPNLLRLAGESLDFRDIASTEGSGWTIAGLVASQCGVPLTTARGDENSMGRMRAFLPGAVCLGDYLRTQGYRNVFLGGADAEFAAKGRFLDSHGFDEVRDVKHFRQAGIAKEHFSNWGLHDDVLLDDAFDTFLRLSEGDRPFLLSTLTMDTHHPAGHLPVACRDMRHDSPMGDIGLLHALKCTDVLIARLVERIRRSPHAENTLIVVASDHLAMPNHLSHVLDGMRRENLLLFLAPDIAPRQLTVAGSTLDSGATLLHLLDPARDAFGFGRSLLAERSAPGATAAALDGDGAGFAPYLAHARTLWTGEDVRTLRIEDDQLRVGLQHVKPPVMLEYDADWRLRAITLEDAPHRFVDGAPSNVRAYVDRCTAFDEDALRGEWCAMLLDRQDNLGLFADADLQAGVRIDSPLAAAAGPRPRPRRAITLGNESGRLLAGQYQLRLRPRALPAHGFWVEAVSSDGRIVHARKWVHPGPAGRQIRIPLGLDTEVEDLEIRAWLDVAEHMELDALAMVRTRRGGRS